MDAKEGQEGFKDIMKYPHGWFGFIVREKNGQLEILLAKRKDYDIWNLPGGGEEVEGEGKWGTLPREVLEETGLEIKPSFTNIAAVDSPRKTDQPIGAEKRPDRFSGSLCVIMGGELKLTSEAKGIRWFPIVNLPENTYERHKFLIEKSFIDDPGYADLARDIAREHKFIPEGIGEKE